MTEQSTHNPEEVQGPENPPSLALPSFAPQGADGESQSDYASVAPPQEASVAESGAGESPAEEAPIAASPANGETASFSPEPSEPVAVAESVPEPLPAKPKGAKSRKPAAEPAPVAPTDPKSENMNWYILKVQSNREESIREGLLRRVAIQGLDRFFGEVIVPTEKVTEFKGGKKRVIKRKLYPGYLVVHMEINEDTWFLVRETPGIGDFTGASGVPSPMLPHEVERIVAKQEEKSEKAPDLKIPFLKGDRVKVIEGNFENFEGEVENIDKTNGRVTVMITIFNRTTPVEFEYWQVESL